jgi:DNA-binding CsgD family transcriptional regulator
VEQPAKTPRPIGAPTSMPTPRLTLRELECLRLLADGESTKRIAFRLGISAKTVQHHVAAARAKLGGRNSVHVVALAISAGLLG